MTVFAFGFSVISIYFESYSGFYAQFVNFFYFVKLLREFDFVFTIDQAQLLKSLQLGYIVKGKGLDERHVFSCKRSLGVIKTYNECFFT